MDNQNEFVRRGYSRTQIDEMGFDVSEYEFPKGPGRATGTLVMKQWGNKCLICYFDLDTGDKLRLTVWWKGDDRSYCPKGSDIDMSCVEIGTRMEIAYDVGESGLSLFLYANDGKEVYSA